MVLKVRFEGVGVNLVKEAMVKGEEDGGEWIVNCIGNLFWF